MRQWRYLLAAAALLVVLGVLLVAGILSTRRVMLGMLKDEARSFLSLVALSQENSIFAEAKFEDVIIGRFVAGVHSLEETGLDRSGMDRFLRDFGARSIQVFSHGRGTMFKKAGYPGLDTLVPLPAGENLAYRHDAIGKEKIIRIQLRTDRYTYQIESPAAEIDDFRKEFGVNRILSQLAANPMVSYLVLQDHKGIILATPNIKTINRIESDSLLAGVLGNGREGSRIAEFENKKIMELAQPFVIEGNILGVFRIGISLDSYYQHVRQTQNQLIILFVILFIIGAAGLVVAMRLQKFEKDREEAERLSFLGNLVANFAHEIKNPLNSLSIATQRLIREYPSRDEEHGQLTSGIKKGIDSLNRILNDFLTLARPKMKENAEFVVAQTMNDVFAISAERFKEARIALVKDIAPDLKLTGNPEDFKRAFLNILLNAADAVGQVPDRDRVVMVMLRKNEKTVVLSVVDNGVGMDREEQDRIFTPYFTTKKGGTGLGLYIAQKIIKEHGGRIQIRSEKNRGTEFAMVFEGSIKNA
jgi:signal transduction histidine kinase